MRWVRIFMWVLGDFVRHPILNVRNFHSAFRQGYDLARQGYELDWEVDPSIDGLHGMASKGQMVFKRRVGTFIRQDDGSWKWTDAGN